MKPADPARVARTAAVALVIVGLLSLAAAPPADALSREAQDTRTWFERMGETFENNPELKTTPGSGWKPYNRLKWFHEQRMYQGEHPSPTARWEAWQVKQERSRQNLSRATAWFSLGPATSTDSKKSNSLVL